MGRRASASLPNGDITHRTLHKLALGFAFGSMSLLGMRYYVFVPCIPVTVMPSSCGGGSVFDNVGLGPHDVVLDLGCGDGRWVVAAALRGCTSRGLDLNEDLLEKGRCAATEAGVSIRRKRSLHFAGKYRTCASSSISCTVSHAAS